VPSLTRAQSTRRWLLCIVAAAALDALVPVRAEAHGALKSSVPAAGARLSTAPRELRLTFTEATELSFTRLELVGPDSAGVALDSLRFADTSRRTVVAAILGALRSGTYRVVWQMAGKDGHPIRGRFTFAITPGTTGLATSNDTVLEPKARPAGGEPAASVPVPGQGAVPPEHHVTRAISGGAGFNAESPAYVAIRWMQFVMLLAVIGAVSFSVLVLGSLTSLARGSTSRGGTATPDAVGGVRHGQLVVDARGRAALLGAWASATLAAIVGLRLFAQSYAMHGDGEVLNVSLIATMLAETVWGWGWALQAASVVVALAGFLIARRGRRAGWVLAALGAVGLAFAPALSGHASSAPELTTLAILTDTVHVISAGGWLGSLFFVIGVGLPATLRLEEGERGPAAADLVNAFSPAALGFAAGATVTGVVSAWLHLGSLPPLWQTSYGRVLLLKLGVLSVVVGTGAHNWLRVKPSLGSLAGAARIRRSGTVELVATVLVLLVTAVLVATPTPRDAAVVSATSQQSR
jgi:putative copper export protein/methionine-rich copper-binding protein CopC